MAVSITGAFKPVPVDLWGEEYETIDPPRSKQRKMAELGAFIDDIEELAALEERPLTDDEEDALVGLLAETIDQWLAHTDSTKKSKPSTVIKRKWDKEELTKAQLLDFVTRIRLEQEGGERPTQD